MIKSFSDKNTEELYVTGRCRSLPSTLINIALRKLDYLNAALSINDLKVPPGNRLEALKGDLEGYFSIRVNDQYRLVFSFIDGNAYDVRVYDYHK